MKIALINPPRSPHNGILDHAPQEALPFIHRKLVGPPLGLITVAAALRDCEGEHQVTLLEMKGEYDLDPNAPPLRQMVRRHLEETRPDLVGVTFIASEFPAGIEIFDEVKAVDPGITTVAGGLHATLCPGDFVNTPTDIVIPGQAARSFVDTVNTLASNGPLEKVKGIHLLGDGDTRYTGDRPVSIDSAGPDFIMPDRSLVEQWKDTYVVGRGIGPATYLFSSLGCTYKCSFCSIWPQYGGAYFKRNVESIIEELKGCDQYPVVRFADANSVVDHEYMEALFDRILEEGLKKTYVMDIRVDAAAANPALIEKMARAGLTVVISGFESFRDEELSAYNKSSQAVLIRRAVEVFHDNGIMIRGNYVIPPDYGDADFRALADYAGTHKVAYAGYTILTPMPGTPHYFEQHANIVDYDLAKYNFFNAVLPTRLPLDDFYRKVASLWLIREGTDVI